MRLRLCILFCPRFLFSPFSFRVEFISEDEFLVSESLSMDFSFFQFLMGNLGFYEKKSHKNVLLCETFFWGLVCKIFYLFNSNHQLDLKRMSGVPSALLGPEL